VVIEGNTRTTVLRGLRVRLEREIQAVREVVNRLGKLRTVTANIQVRVVNAATSAELGDILPHLHSARHINHAKQWSRTRPTWACSTSIGSYAGRSTRVPSCGGVRSPLYGGEGDPFADGPHVIGQPGGHRRRSCPPPPVLALHPQGSHRPAEVVRVVAEPGGRHVRVPRLRELVPLPPLAAAPPAVRPVVPLDERRVHHPADGRQGQRQQVVNSGEKGSAVSTQSGSA
jgi:hypothetical protein